MIHWLIWRSPLLNWHLFGSRVVFGRLGKRTQVMLTLDRRRRFSFGWGPRPEPIVMPPGPYQATDGKHCHIRPAEGGGDAVQGSR